MEKQLKTKINSNNELEYYEETANNKNQTPTIFDNRMP